MGINMSTIGNFELENMQQNRNLPQGLWSPIVTQDGQKDPKKLGAFSMNKCNSS